MIETSTVSRRSRIQILEAENAALRAQIAETGWSRAESIEAGFRSGLAAAAERLASVEDLNAQLRTSEEFNRRILSATTDGVEVLDLDGRIISMNDGGLAFLSAANFAAIVGRPLAEFWPLAESRTAVERAVSLARSGRASRFQAAFDAGEATTWWDIAVAPMNGSDGRPERILAVSREITELKQNEARQMLLMQEMAHRVKNTLAIVQAVASQTLRNAVSLDAASESLGARLLALAQAHDVLMQGSWASASLVGIVDGAVALHGDGEPDRFRITGTDVTLGPKPALTLALMLHELCTNAAKYGALSCSRGHVAITWDIDARAGLLRLRWEEVDGPPVRPPSRTGFGSRLIERSLVHSFGGTARLSYPETGVVLTMDAPLAQVVVEGATA